MSLRTSLRNLIRRSPVIALHERSAELRGSLSRQTAAAGSVSIAAPLLAPGSPEARAAWHAACREHSERLAAFPGRPELDAPAGGVWTTRSLMHAMETGQITVAEYARLHPIASERELRIAEITHELRVGELFALAYADEYPINSAGMAPPDPAFDLGADQHIAELADRFCQRYREHAEADRAMMAGEISEAEWEGPHNAVIALARELAAAVPSTLAGVALKCLGPVAIEAWQLGTNADPAGFDTNERIAAEVQAAILSGSASQSIPSPERQWAVEQAARVDLSGLGICELHSLYNQFAGAADTWSAASCVPWAQQDLNAGEIVEREEQRAAEIRDRIVAEIRGKVPTESLEAGWRLEILIRRELLCEGSLRHVSPELRAEIAEDLGG